MVGREGRFRGPFGGFLFLRTKMGKSGCKRLNKSKRYFLFFNKMGGGGGCCGRPSREIFPFCLAHGGGGVRDDASAVQYSTIINIQLIFCFSST